jgi:spermidine synthase
MRPERSGPRLHLEIFLLSAAAIVLEVSYTRVFSFKLFYYFTYLIIGIALLGVGAGGVLLATLPSLRRVPVARLVARVALAGAVAVPLGYLVVALVQLNTLHVVDDPRETAKLVLLCAALFAQFLVAGLGVAAILSSAPGDVSRLYAADLAGAALACAVSIPLLRLLTPAGCIMTGALLYCAAAVRGGARPLVAAPLAIVLVALALVPQALPDPIADQAKTMAPQRRGASRVLFSRWDPVFRVDVVEHPVPTEPQYILNHDGTWGSVLKRFDGDFAKLGAFETDARAYPFRLSPPPRDVLVIGAAGGHEILASLYFQAAHVTGVELNPVTVSLLTTHFADFTGHLTADPRVTLVNAEGRSFLRGDPRRWDLVWFVAPDSYAAMNAATSGAFVLSESYLYTVEMIVDTLAHLAPHGFLCMQFGEIDFDHRPNRTVRYLATAREALRRVGIDDFARHVLVASAPSFGSLSTILVAKDAFPPERVEEFVRATARIPGGIVRHAPGVPSEDGLVPVVVAAPPAAVAERYRSYPYEVGAVTDDSPFFWHFTSFRRSISRALRGQAALLDPSEGAGERVLLALLGCVVVMAAVALLLPFVAVRHTWADLPHRGRAALYFAAIGVGFMLWEIVLIQKLTLLLGYPTYSLTVTLFALLLSTGAGSFASERWIARRDRSLVALLAALVVLSLFFQLGLGPLVDRLGGASLGVRIGVAVALLVPLGCCLGAFMPLGLATVARLGSHAETFVAWAWAVNGFASVTSSILAVILSMVLGFNAVLVAALATYVVAVVTLRGLPRPA